MASNKHIQQSNSEDSPLYSQPKEDDYEQDDFDDNGDDELQGKAVNDEEYSDNLDDDYIQPGDEDNNKKSKTTEQQEQERDIIRILLNHGDKTMTLNYEDEEGDAQEEELSVQKYILEELCEEKNVVFKDALYSKIWTLFQSAFVEERELSIQHLERHPDASINKAVADLTTEKYTLHNWGDRKIYPKSETEQLQRMADEALNRLRLKTVMLMMKETQVTMHTSKNTSKKNQTTIKI